MSQSGTTRVLIVDDEPAIRRLLRASLGAEGYRTEEAATGTEALKLAGDADIIVLDLGLPDLDGLDVIRTLRATSAVPIVVLTSREAESSKVAALDLGADDYVTKPFGIAELMARLRAALRHRLQAENTPPVFQSGDLTVDLVRRIVRVGSRDVHLSPREYDILTLLVVHAGKVLTHRHVLGKLWGASADVQQLRVYVRQLRQKIETDAERPRHILTETGIGYRLAIHEPPHTMTLILTGLRATTKPTLLAELARHAATTLGRDAAPIARLLTAREALGSTGTGGGIALPHARLPNLTTPATFFTRLKHPIPFDAIDNTPVDLIFLLLSPEGADSTHLTLLAAAARHLRNPTPLRTARTPEELAAALEGIT